MPPAKIAPDKKRFVKRMVQSFTECSAEAKQYGTCVALPMEGIEHKACEKEFLAMSECFRGALKKAPKS